MATAGSAAGTTRRRGMPATSPGAGRPIRTPVRAPAVFDADALLADRSTKVVVCCGSGGVGKTTTAAALALRAAEQGRSVVVLTIDPARRLAQSLGLVELDNTPRPVAGIDPAAGGSLDAMMLDMKRTFDDVVLAHASPAKAAAILANPFYQTLSSSFAGTQEYMAMEKLGQLHLEASQTGRWDLIVVDTPPSRSALDFLDAPKRLGSFLDGRLIRLLLAPARTGGRAYLKVIHAGTSAATAALSKVLGGQLLRDVQLFVDAMDSMFGGFRERAEATYSLLKDDRTAFVVVAAPERDALREAAFFLDRLEGERMPLAGLVVNRVAHTSVADLSAARAASGAAALEGDDGPAARLAGDLLTVHQFVAEQAERQQALTRRFVAGHPEVPAVSVPLMAEDVHDVAGLRAVGDSLSAGAGA